MLPVNQLVLQDQTLQGTIEKESATLEILPTITRLVDFEISALQASLTGIDSAFLPLNGAAPIEHIHKIVGAQSFDELGEFSVFEIRRKINYLFGLGIKGNHHVQARYEGPPTDEFAKRHGIDLDDPDQPTPNIKMPEFSRIECKDDAKKYLADFMCIAVPGEVPRTAN